MADFSAPSFSLGLDLDVDPDLSTEEEQGVDGGGRRGDADEEGSPLAGPSSSRHHLWGDEEEDEVDFVLKTQEEDPPPPSPAFKRLRRGPPPRRPPEAPQSPLAEPSTSAAPLRQLPVAGDGIAVLSSQEDYVIRDEYSSRQGHSACSISKFSLREQRVFTTYARKLKPAKTTPSSNGSVPICLEANNDKKIPPRLTTNPLRRIQLPDSDLDDLSDRGDEQKDVIEVDACHKNWLTSAHSVPKAQRENTEFSSGKLQRENLWKDSSLTRNINLATPALDEFCEEYFKAVNSSQVDKCSKEQSQQTTITSSSLRAPDVVDGAETRHEESCISASPEHNWNLPHPRPPSYQYFYHSDVRIQKLVRQRLPNFIPLGDVKCIQMQQSNAATLDYVSQFGQGEVPLQVGGACEKAVEGNSNCRSRKQKNMKDKNVADASGSWVNPRSSSAIPKDAGKRLVHAARHSSGHWYTGQDGRKVYVTRNGQELSGRNAYRHYRKESGAGFRKSRKKAATPKRKRKR